MQKELLLVKAELADTKAELATTKAELASTKAELVITQQKLLASQTENVKLKERIKELEQGKHSGNSSLPPSKDTFSQRIKKTQSLRQKSELKAGGQQGHKGTNLKLVAQADVIEECRPNQCEACGCAQFDTSTSTIVSKRQVIDIPPIKPITTEYQQIQLQCKCGHCSTGAYPQGVDYAISYGKNIETMIGYLSQRQYMAIDRIKEMFAQVFNTPISAGTICNKIKSLAQRCLAQYEAIREQISVSKVAGADETGCKVNGTNTWFWVVQDETKTFIIHSPSRSKTTLDLAFPNGLGKTTLVHDCWTSYFKLDVANHQICQAHLLRELNFFIEQRKSKWPYLVRQILLKSQNLKQKILNNPSQNYQHQIEHLKKKAKEILNQAVEKKYYKMHCLQKRLINKFEYIFTFLHHQDVPPDNNASERAIRNVKVKQKISGQFKNEEFANYFAIIRSVMDTFLKNDKPLFNAMFDL